MEQGENASGRGADHSNNIMECIDGACTMELAVQCIACTGAVHGCAVSCTLP